MKREQAIQTLQTLIDTAVKQGGIFQSASIVFQCQTALNMLAEQTVNNEADKKE
jgi:hypothetical protein